MSGHSEFFSFTDTVSKIRSGEDGIAVSTCSPPVAQKRVKVNVDRNSSLKVVGLFAGVGGVEEGFRQAGHESEMLCEIDPHA